MMYRKTNSIAAILVMAVIFIGLLGGCATMKQANEIKEQVRQLQQENRESHETIARMDSLLKATTETNRQLKNDVRVSTDELANQMSQLLENYNDLMTRLDQVGQQRVISLPPTSSPGSQVESSMGTETEQAPASAIPDTECIDIYDNAFTQTRRGEYEAGLNLFREFLTKCEGHENSENAYFWIGECLYSLDRYSEAVTELQHLVNTYPDSPNLGRAYYKLARCHHELGHTAEAKGFYQKLVEDYPGTYEADQASRLLEELE